MVWQPLEPNRKDWPICTQGFPHHTQNKSFLSFDLSACAHSLRLLHKPVVTTPHIRDTRFHCISKYIICSIYLNFYHMEPLPSEKLLYLQHKSYHIGWLHKKGWVAPVLQTRNLGDVVSQRILHLSSVHGKCTVLIVVEGVAVKLPG